VCAEPYSESPKKGDKHVAGQNHLKVTDRSRNQRCSWRKTQDWRMTDPEIPEIHGDSKPNQEVDAKGREVWGYTDMRKTKESMLRKQQPKERSRETCELMLYNGYSKRKPVVGSMRIASRTGGPESGSDGSTHQRREARDMNIIGADACMRANLMAAWLRSMDA